MSKRWILVIVVLGCASLAMNAMAQTAVCRDGTPSYSAHRRGTCSHHGGVAQWTPFHAATTSQLTPSSSADSQFNQEFALYLAVTTGKRSMQSLTDEQQRQVRAIAAVMARPRYTSQKCEALADAEDQLQSARDDLRSCLAIADGDDDCESQMQDVRDAQDEYESAKSDAEDDCQ